MKEKQIQLFREFYHAVVADNVERVTSLLKSNASMLNEQTHLGTWLDVAATHRAYNVATSMIDHGLSPNHTFRESGVLPITTAAMIGDAKMVKLLLDCGSNISTDSTDTNPLFSAIVAGSKDVVSLLLDRGIDPLVRYGKRKGDAIAFAIMHNRLEIADSIADHAAAGDQDLKMSLLSYSNQIASLEPKARQIRILPD